MPSIVTHVHWAKWIKSFGVSFEEQGEEIWLKLARLLDS